MLLIGMTGECHSVLKNCCNCSIHTLSLATTRLTVTFCFSSLSPLWLLRAAAALVSWFCHKQKRSRLVMESWDQPKTLPIGGWQHGCAGFQSWNLSGAAAVQSWFVVDDSCPLKFFIYFNMIFTSKISSKDTKRKDRHEGPGTNLKKCTQQMFRQSWFSEGHACAVK